MNKNQKIRFVLLVVMFAGINAIGPMVSHELRGHIPSIWIRAAIAGCVCGSFAWCALRLIDRRFPVSPTAQCSRVGTKRFGVSFSRTGDGSVGSSSMPSVRLDLKPKVFWPTFLGIVGFGVGMGWRGEFESVWAQAAIAGCAAAFLAACLSVALSRMKDDENKHGNPP
jgi:membrane associated rhomboid family serine protease